MKTSESTHPHLLAQGQWNEDIAWEFYLSSELPEPQLCTAVFCVALAGADLQQIVLTQTHRGWEMLGGHIEPGETIEQALRREAIEEGGFHISEYQLFGYRKVIASKPIANDHHGGYYPATAYTPHFVAITGQPLSQPTGEEVTRAAAFDIQSMPDLGANAAIAQAGIAHAQSLNGLSNN